MIGRRRYTPGKITSFPIAPNTGGYGTPQASSTPYATDKSGGIRATAENYPRPFDYRAITTAPASGSTIYLVGDARSTLSVGIFNATLVPMGHVGEVIGIYPYLEDALGPVTGPRVPGAGVQITWSVLVNGRPTNDYGTITDIVQPWSAPSNTAPLMYLFGGEMLTATVSVVDPAALYKFVGIRIRGRILSARLVGMGKGYGR